MQLAYNWHRINTFWTDRIKFDLQNCIIDIFADINFVKWNRFLALWPFPPSTRKFTFTWMILDFLKALFFKIFAAKNVERYGKNSPYHTIGHPLSLVPKICFWSFRYPQQSIFYCISNNKFSKNFEIWSFRSCNFFSKNFLEISKKKFWNIVQVFQNWKNYHFAFENSSNHHIDQNVDKFSPKTPKSANFAIQAIIL